MTFEIKDPFAYYNEVRRLIDMTSRNRDKPFSKDFPQVYGLYLEISAHHYKEFKQRSKKEVIPCNKE